LSYSGDYSASSNDVQVLPANQTGQKDLADALNLIFKHPNTGPFICKQLIQRLVTDNPSPAYVYRVSQAFADNGQGVRGDMKAVIRAILTDYEARSTAFLPLPGYGHLKEPLLRMTAVMRGFHPLSTSGWFKVSRTDEIGQTALHAPTVFNFFEPGFVYPGTLAENGLVSPEFQITSETTAIALSNLLETGTRTTFKGGDIRLDLTTEINLTIPNLVDRLNNILMAGQMSAGMKTTLTNYLTNTAGLTGTTRAQHALHLVATSPEFSVQK